MVIREGWIAEGLIGCLLETRLGGLLAMLLCGGARMHGSREWGFAWECIINVVSRGPKDCERG